MTASKKFQQTSPSESPWPIRSRLKRFLWEITWNLLCRHTPKPFNPWRVFVLHVFGAKIQGTPFVHQRAKVEIPENLSLRHRACLGDGSITYSSGPIEIGEGDTIAQEAYPCTGTHDFDDPALPLITGPIGIAKRAFVGARAFNYARSTYRRKCHRRGLFSSYP
jgi:putative colanic acid biosynthesis acetyltransferase WcaF